MNYNKEQTSIVLDDGRHVPVDMTNADYQKIVNSGAVVEPYQEDLGTLQDQLIEAVLRDAESVRLKYITPGDGKSMSYREGYEEAVEVLGNPQAALDLVGQDAGDTYYANACEEAYPVLYPDIGKGGTTDIAGIAALVSVTFKAFQKLENTLKKISNPAVNSIKAATTVGQAYAAHNAISWPE